MSDIRKAAILLMSLPEEQAGQLMTKLAPKQIEQVSIEIAKLGRLSGEDVYDRMDRAIAMLIETFDGRKMIDRRPLDLVNERRIVGWIQLFSSSNGLDRVVDSSVG